MCSTYSTVGRSITNVYDPRLKAPKYIYCQDRIIEAIDQPTVLYVHSIQYGECTTDEPFA